MSLLSESKQLYRVAIVEECPASTFWESFLLGGGFGRPRSGDSFKGGTFGFFPIELTGWVVSRDNRKYFEPDVGQDGVDLFMDADQPCVYFPYSLIVGHYQIIG